MPYVLSLACCVLRAHLGDRRLGRNCSPLKVKTTINILNAIDDVDLGYFRHNRSWVELEVLITNQRLSLGGCYDNLPAENPF